MATPLIQDNAGAEFDKWLDWNGIPDNTSKVGLNLNTTNRTLDPALIQFPVSPSSTIHTDNPASATRPHSLAAPSVHDLPTPTHSFDSPGARSSTEFRLGGEALLNDHCKDKRINLKRKLSPPDSGIDDLDVEGAVPAVKKRPHNDVEKKYRKNLNEKIAELRDSVPSLRSTKKVKSKDESNDDIVDGEDLDGLSPSTKLNKASILSKAVEYIQHLESRNKRLEIENKALKERLETLDKVIARGGNDAQRATAFTSTNVIEESPSDSNDSSGEKKAAVESTYATIKGKIGIPESWRRLRQSSSQEHYGQIYDASSERFSRGKWPTRIMLGSVAGLLVMEGFSESNIGTDSREKGLFGIPLELLDGWEFLHSPRIYLAAFTKFCRAGGILPLVKGFLALTIMAFIVFAYLFNSKPTPKEDIEHDTVQTTQPAGPASPIEVRRRAWSTSMQALHLPHHGFFAEWSAVTFHWLKYSLHYLFGASAYLWLTGTTSDDEGARIKSWDIAIDAQLAGGDVEISRSRVVLTSFGSGTLPRTPLRLMLKSLHCRVLLWHVGFPGTPTARVATRIARYFANREWRRARQLHSRLSAHHHDHLPPYLKALLALDCDDVFLDLVTQRAYNLMYDRPTPEHAEDPLMDVVVEDHAIRSPLDAIAAWCSTCSLRKALQLSQEISHSAEEVQKLLITAVQVSPPGSAAETRALAVYGVLGRKDVEDAYSRAVEAIARPVTPERNTYSMNDVQLPMFIDSSTPKSARAEIANALHCARTRHMLEHGGNPELVLRYFGSNPIQWHHSTIITSVVVKNIIWRFAQFPNISDELSGLLALSSREQPAPAASESEVWTPNVTTTNIANVYSMPMGMSYLPRRQSIESNDTGYVSQDEYDGYDDFVNGPGWDSKDDYLHCYKESFV